MILLRTYVRADEQQYVFLVEHDGAFFIIEQAELWELPMVDGADTTYAFYPTVFGGEPYPSPDQADRRIRQLYPWTASED